MAQGVFMSVRQREGGDYCGEASDKPLLVRIIVSTMLLHSAFLRLCRQSAFGEKSSTLGYPQRPLFSNSWRCSTIKPGCILS